MRSIFFLFTFSFCIVHFALSQVPQDREGLLNAEGMGQAAYAERNGYPGPKHALELAKELQLSDTQKKSLRSLVEEMTTRGKELGERIIQIEEEMNKAFENGVVTEKSVRADADQIGRLRGKLRALHLNAHLKAKKILTEKQIEMYRKLRKTESGKQ